MVSLVQGVTFQHLRYFLQLTRETRELDVEFLTRLYGDRFSNFDAIVAVFQELGLVTVDGEKIVKTNQIEQLDIRVLLDEEYSQKYLIDLILDSKTSICDEAISYLSKFQMRDGKYLYRPTIEVRILESPIRNLLIELELVYYDSQTSTYYISEKHLDEFLKVASRLPFSPADLEDALRRRREIGLAAELEIVAYERSRLSSNEHHLESIRHVSLKDVSCGYDIFSFENEMEYVNRFIEVKAVSIYDYAFTWSRAEIEVAKKLKYKYYLYLLPVRSPSKFDRSALLIISDPVVNVLGSQKWKSVEETIRVSIAPLSR